MSNQAKKRASSKPNTGVSSNETQMKLRSSDQKTLDPDASVLLVNSKLKPVDFSSSSSSENEDYVGKSSTKTNQKEAANAKSALKKDYWNIALLMFLYFLQGIPLGLTGSLPFILSSRKVSYADQGTFSFAFWPFSLKLLWAPIVDAIFIKRLGRRKSWLVPIQYLLGIFMLLFSSHIRDILDTSHQNSHKGTLFS